MMRRFLRISNIILMIIYFQFYFILFCEKNFIDFFIIYLKIESIPVAEL